MFCFVTGGTGLVGNNVIRCLLQNGHSVRALIREGSGSRALAGLDVETVIGDIRDADSVRSAARNVDVVINAAADLHIGWTRIEQARSINVAGTQNLLDAAMEQTARFIHVSSVDALAAAASEERPVDEQTPIQPKVPCTYVLTKREAEDRVTAAIENGLDAVIVNPGFMLGPWDWKPSSGRMLISVATSFTPIAPRGGMSGCDVRDVAAAIVAITTGSPQHRRYILAGENMRYYDAWRLFARITGGKPPFRRMRPEMAKLIGAVGDLWTNISGRETDINSAMLTMSRLFNYYDSNRAFSEFGYQSRPFESTVRDAWKWLQEHHRIG
ncbi:MAG: NAD-dependent epimerase/dehydratase family protein [Pirellulaceae bacterium]